MHFSLPVQPKQSNAVKCTIYRPVFGTVRHTHACTRAVYLGSDDLIITGRSMDWMENMNSSIWIFPKGMNRDGLAGPDSPKWTSKYGSVITAVYNIAAADGMNERGLVMNMLYLAGSFRAKRKTR